MRPTIPLGGWRIASDLTKARTLASARPTPPCERACPWCRNWTVAWQKTLPVSLATELRRLGIDPALPSDLYASHEPSADDPRQIPTRVTFHAMGEILSGPATWMHDDRFGPVRHYAAVDGVRGGLSVVYEREIGGEPEWYSGEPALLVQVDFRIDVPWVLAEDRPEVFASPPRVG